MTRLAERMRPAAAHPERLVGPARRVWQQECSQWLRAPFHVVFWGPPGCGKTTLARMLSEASGRSYVHLSAVRDGVREIREAAGANPDQLLFIDEIHRLSRSQQDVLLPILEHDESWVIGATTESPAGVFQPALLSRLRLVRVGAPPAADISSSLERGIALLTEESGSDPESAVFARGVRRVWQEHRAQILRVAGGDVRLAWNIVESLVGALSEAGPAAQGATAEDDAVRAVFDNLQRAYTRGRHYDYASAMIKSMRGSDPDAALYYAMAALDGGEDVVFLLRRCVIFASEDVGNADPQALGVATHAHYAASHVGMPEARIPLAQAVTYLAATVKSNRSYAAIGKVREWRERVEGGGGGASPSQGAPPAALVIKGSEEYVYPHDRPGAFVRMEYLPPGAAALRRSSGPAYRPTQHGFEARLGERLARLWSAEEGCETEKRKGQGQPAPPREQDSRTNGCP